MNVSHSSVHSRWDSEAKAIATMMDLNRWESMVKMRIKESQNDSLPNNVIPFRPKKIAKSG